MFFVIIHLHINTMALPSRDVLSLFRRDNIQVRSPSSSIIVIVWDKCVGTEWLSCLLYAHVSRVIYRLQTSKAKVCHRTQTLFRRCLTSNPSFRKPSDLNTPPFHNEEIMSKSEPLRWKWCRESGHIWFTQRRWRGPITRGSALVFSTHCNDTRRTAEGNKYF